MMWKEQYNKPVTEENYKELKNKTYYEIVASRNHDKILIGDVIVFALLCVKDDEKSTDYKMILVHPEQIDTLYTVVKDKLIPLIKYK